MGWLWLRVKGHDGKPTKWQTISYKGEGPVPSDRDVMPGLLKLKTDQGWVEHTSPTTPDSKPLRLDVKGCGWQFALAMGYAIPTHVVQFFPNIQYLNYPFLTRVEYDLFNSTSFLRSYDDTLHNPQLFGADLRMSTRIDSHGADYQYLEQQTTTWYVLDLGWFADQLPPNTAIAGANLRLQIRTSGVTQRATSGVPQDWHWYIWQVYNRATIDKVQLSNWGHNPPTSNYQFAYPDTASYVVSDTDGIVAGTLIHTGTFTATDFADEADGFVRADGRTEVVRFVSLAELQAADHIVFVFTTDREGQVPYPNVHDPAMTSGSNVALIELQIGVTDVQIDYLNYDYNLPGH